MNRSVTILRFHSAGLPGVASRAYFTRPLRSGASLIRRSPQCRMLSTSTSQQRTPQELIGSLSKLCPMIPVRAEDVDIILDPNQFFTQLKDRIRTAKRRVVLAALYLGNEPKPLELVQVIRESLERNRDLQVTFVLDYLRGTRGITKDSPERPNSSAGIVSGLAAAFPGRVRGAFWHTPRVAGLAKRLVPERVVELVGVQHIKCFIIDDDVMLSGANLSEQYFTDRQDRYYWFKQNSSLTQFYAKLLEVVESLSFSTRLPGEHIPAGATLHESTGLFLRPGVPDPSTDPKSYKRLFKKQMESFWKDNLAATAQQMQNGDTWVLPTVQVGPCDVLIDQKVVDITVESTSSDQSIHIATPYCNFTNDFANHLIHRCASQDVRVSVASPQANGFFKGKGAHTIIPWAYSQFLEQFHKLLVRAGQDSRIKLFEYERPEWTYHAKGLWTEWPQRSSATRTGLTIVGSSNFGVRSAYRDLEAQAVVFTQNAQLLDRMNTERRNIFDSSYQVSSQAFASRKQYTPWWLSSVLFFAKRFM